MLSKFIYNDAVPITKARTPNLIDENKWRAVRYGLEGNLIDLGKMEERPAREMVCELIEKHIDDVLEELGSRKEVEFADKILKEGSSADRQIETYKKSGDFKPVVNQLIKETAMGTGIID